MGRMVQAAAIATVATVLAMTQVLALPVAFAGEDEDAMAEMQKRLNEQVMEKPFSVEEKAKIDAYIEDAMKKDLKPPGQPPATWRQGYTCSDLRASSYYDYRNCLYYHRYYGRYW